MASARAFGSPPGPSAWRSGKPDPRSQTPSVAVDKTVKWILIGVVVAFLVAIYLAGMRWPELGVASAFGSRRRVVSDLAPA